MRIAMVDSGGLIEFLGYDTGAPEFWPHVFAEPEALAKGRSFANASGSEVLINGASKKSCNKILDSA